MNELVTQFAEYLNSRFASPHTVRNYCSDVNQFYKCAAELGFDPLKLDRASTFLYLGFLAKKYASRATIMRKRDSLKQFYKFLQMDGHVKRNEFEFLARIKKEEKLPEHLSQTEAAYLIDSIKPNPMERLLFGGTSTGPFRAAESRFLAIRDTAMLETMYACGIRAQETANLNWVDVDFRAGFIRINQGKGGRDRIVPITELSMEALWEYGKAYRKRFEIEPSGTNPVFMSRRRMRITTRSIQRAVVLRGALAGIKIKPHGLRHSFATHLVQRGADIVSVGACLGHASLSTTQKYVHLTLVDVIGAYDKAHPRA